MPVVYKGQWGLNENGYFRSDPWYLVHNKVIVQSGFQKPPREYPHKILEEGVILPGLVNSHTHLQFSWFHNSGLEKYTNVHEFAKSVMTIPAPSMDEQIGFARSCLAKARAAGTFYFVDISNSPEFSGAMSSLDEFEGLRLLELLGFSDPADRKRIEMAELALKDDRDLHLAPHSMYGSSPRIFSYIQEREKRISSIHLFEEEEEALLFQESGRTFNFLGQIGQYRRYSEIFQNTPVEYLRKFLPKSSKLLLVHMTFADEFMLNRLEEDFPGAAIVVCSRSNKNLGYTRKNWRALTKLNLPLLLGTDSCASSPDISILHEIADLVSLDVLAVEQVWKAATSNAYQYLNLTSVPYFLFPGAFPEIQSLIKTTPIKMDGIRDSKLL